MTILTPANPTLLSDGASAVTASGYGAVNGAVATFDTGAANTRWDGIFVANVSAVSTGGGQTYSLTVQGCNDPSFQSGVAPLGSVTVGAPGQTTPFPVFTLVDGVNYRYMRLLITVGGTGPSITVQAFVMALTALSTLSLAQLVQLFGVYADNWSDATSNFRAWMVGVVGGGPNNDGRYPLTDGQGTTVLVSCPAAIAAGAGAALTTTTLDSLAAVSQDTVGSPNAANPAWAVAVDNPAGGRQLNKVNFFPARRTADLQSIMSLVGTELIPALDVNGLEKRIAVNALSSIFNRGFISPLNYGAKWDLKVIQANAISTAGSNVIQDGNGDGMFSAADLNKTVMLTNAGPDHGTLTSTIVAIIDSNHVQLADAASVNEGNNRMYWGANDTAANQAAIDACAPRGLYDVGGFCQLPAACSWSGGLRYHARMAIVGYGNVSQLFRWPEPAYSSGWNPSGSAYPFPQLGNINNQVDFPVITNLTLDGTQYLFPPGTNVSRAFEFVSVPGAQSLPQIDPWIQFLHIRIFNCGQDAFHVYGRNTGTIENISIAQCNGYGFWSEGYDANILGLYIEAARRAGIYFGNSSANNNCQNWKSSYCGSGWSLGSSNEALKSGDTSNVYFDPQSQGNTLVAGRSQESWGHGLVVSGFKNLVSQVQIQDTSDQWPINGSSGNPTPATGNALSYRAGVAVIGGAATKNKILDVDVDTDIHPTNYATHALFLDNDGGNNLIRMYAQRDDWYNPANNPSGAPMAATTGVYAPGTAGTNDPGGTFGTNAVNMNLQTISGPIP